MNTKTPPLPNPTPRPSIYTDKGCVVVVEKSLVTKLIDAIGKISKPTKSDSNE